jgi:hypothetical protein
MRLQVRMLAGFAGKRLFNRTSKTPKMPGTSLPQGQCPNSTVKTWHRGLYSLCESPVE